MRIKKILAFTLMAVLLLVTSIAYAENHSVYDYEGKSYSLGYDSSYSHLHAFGSAPGHYVHTIAQNTTSSTYYLHVEVQRRNGSVVVASADNDGYVLSGKYIYTSDISRPTNSNLNYYHYVQTKNSSIATPIDTLGVYVYE